MADELANPNPSETLREEETPPVTSALKPDEDGVGCDLSGAAAAAASGSDSTADKKEEDEAVPAAAVATSVVEKEGSEVKEKTSEPEGVSVVESEKEGRQEVDERKAPLNLGSFKEESNLVSDLLDSERKALEELKRLVQAALDNKEFCNPPSKTQTSSTESAAIEKAEGHTSESDTSVETKPVQESKSEEEAAASEGISIWGIPILKDDRSDVILLKFLRARDFKVRDAYVMIKNTIRWRKEFNIDGLLGEDLGDDLEKVVFMHGHDKEGHPVCYNVYGEFQNKELYDKTFGDEEKRKKFLRWRIQFLERSIRKLDFSPGGVCTVFQVNDLKNSPGPGKRELRLATKQALHLLQDNYPEFVAKQVFINVPWWYLAFYTILSPFLTPRTKSKFVFAGPSKSADTLLKYIAPEQLPVQYGGLSVDFCDCHPEFTISDPVTEVPIKPNTKQTVEIIIYERCIIVWELRVVGWEVSYGAEFVPEVKNSYTIIIQKPTKMAPADEPVVSNSFKVSELGKILLTIDNPTSKKKRLFYRFKIKPLSG